GPRVGRFQQSRSGDVCYIRCWVGYAASGCLHLRMVASLNSSPEIDSERPAGAELRSAGQVKTPAPTRYSILSRLRSYLVFDPLIWIYTVVLGIISIPFGLFDRNGRILHGFARFWSQLIMKAICSPVNVTGLEKIDTSKPHVYAV